MNLLKSKIAVGVVTVSMLSGVGAVFANTDAGDQLATWYDAQFQTTTTQAWNTVESYFNAKVPALQTWLNTEKNDAKAEVVAAQVAEIDDATTAISDAKQAYIDSLATEQATIETAMPGEFDTFIVGKKAYVDNVGTQARDWANGQIATAVNAQGTTSVTAVDTAVTTVKGDAVAALEDAIADAKDDLQAALVAEKGLAEGELRTYVDTKIDTLKGEIEAATNTLVAQKATAIQAKGSEIETAAIAQMDQMVDAIDN